MIQIHEIDVDPDLIQHILKIKESNPGVKYTNVGGWHSTYTEIIPDWFINKTSIIKEIVGKEYFLNKYWFNVNGQGHYNKWHAHSVKHMVAVYYIKVPSKSGNIEFRKNKTTIFKSFEPKPGQVIIFPGNLEHQVRKNESDDLRISAAFNFKEVQNANQ